MFTKHPVELTFAGFDFPRYIPQIKRVLIKSRHNPSGSRYRGKVECTYYVKPEPNDKGAGFYLDSDFTPGLRWEWCDKIEGVGRGIDHTGWFTDEHGDSDKIRGIVMRLPHGRGFLAGWSMGEGMSSRIEYEIISDEHEAAYRADRLAEIAAEAERDYQADQDESRDDEDDTDTGDCQVDHD